MKKFNKLSEENNHRFFRNFIGEENLDEVTFNMWKDELQKELPSFWEDMDGIIGIRKKQN
jgi:hypothetical protein